MKISTFFMNNDNSPSTNLTPTIKIINLDTQSLVINNDFMVNATEGFYFYEFEEYDVNVNYSFICYSNSVDAIQYTYGVSDNNILIPEIDSNLNDVILTINEMKNKLDVLYAVEGGGWKIDENTNQMIFYDVDNVTEIMRFDLFDTNGVPSHNIVAERKRL